MNAYGVDCAALLSFEVVEAKLNLYVRFEHCSTMYHVLRTLYFVDCSVSSLYIVDCFNVKCSSFGSTIVN